MRQTTAALVALLILAGCSPSSSESAETTSTTLKPVTTAETTTTQATTTTLPGPSDEQLKTALHQAHQELQDFLGTDTRPEGAWDEVEAWVDANMTGEAKADYSEIIESIRSRNLNAVGPPPIWVITSIDWADLKRSETGEITGTVDILQCDLGTIETWDSDDNVVDQRAGLFSPQEFTFTYNQSDERFILSDRQLFGDDRCDPVDELKDGNGVITSEADAQTVLNLHERFYTETLAGIDTRIEGYDRLRASTDEVTIRLANAMINDSYDQFEAEGEFVDGEGYESNVIGMAVEEDRARIVDCSRVAYTGYDSNGKVVEPAEDWYQFMETFMIKEGGKWYVEFHWQGGAQACEP